MYLIGCLKNLGGKVFGQECEVAMCIFGGSKTPTEDPEVKRQREEAIQKEQTEKRTLRQEALSAKVAGIRGGTGRRTLLSSSGGGMGFYNEYNK